MKQQDAAAAVAPYIKKESTFLPILLFLIPSMYSKWPIYNIFSQNYPLDDILVVMVHERKNNINHICPHHHQLIKKKKNEQYYFFWSIFSTNGWILLNVEMMPKILHFLITLKHLLSKVTFSASYILNNE